MIVYDGEAGTHPRTGTGLAKVLPSTTRPRRAESAQCCVQGVLCDGVLSGCVVLILGHDCDDLHCSLHLEHRFEHVLSDLWSDLWSAAARGLVPRTPSIVSPPRLLLVGTLFDEGEGGDAATVGLASRAPPPRSRASAR